MDIFKRILKEFWFPAIVAFVWTVYGFLTRSGTWDLKTIISVFFPSFFLISWATGQYFRIRKQVHVDHNLESIEGRLQVLVQALEEKTKDLVSHITGGESFCYLHLSPGDRVGKVGTFHAIHRGAHNTQEVQVRVVDIVCFHQKKPYAPNQCEFVANIPGLTPGHGIQLSQVVSVGDATLLKFNAFFTARNGDYTQFIRLTRKDAEWRLATKVVKGSLVLYEEVQDGLTYDLSADPDWTPRS